MIEKRNFSVSPIYFGDEITRADTGEFIADTRQHLWSSAKMELSYGPWLALDGQQAVFDASGVNYGLGYNPGPLFGVTQYPSAWNPQWSDDSLNGVRQATSDLLRRKPSCSQFFEQAFSPIEQIRAYIAAEVLEQFPDNSANLEIRFREIFYKLLGGKEPSVASELSRCLATDGQYVSVDFSGAASEPLSLLLAHGLLPKQSAGKKVQLQLPLATTDSDLKFLAGRLIAALTDQAPTVHKVSVPDRSHYYRFSSLLLKQKFTVARNESVDFPEIDSALHNFLSPEIRSAAELVMLDGKNWGKYRDRVDQLQQAIYEPARQTSVMTFDSLFRDEYGFGVLVEIDGQVAGAACAGPLGLFPGERGTLEDSHRSDRHVLYPLDLTVTPEFRGVLGSFLKRAMVLLAVADNHTAFHGRNRDRLAAAMWAINLSLGSYQIRHLPDDYPDSLPYRDCIYYRCPLRWPKNCADASLQEQFQDWLLMGRLVNAQ